MKWRGYNPGDGKRWTGTSIRKWRVARRWRKGRRVGQCGPNILPIPPVYCKCKDGSTKERHLSSEAVRLNMNMLVLLRRRLGGNLGSVADPIELIDVEGCVYNKRELERSAHLKPDSFEDRTGFEAMVNHVHFDHADRSCGSLLEMLSYALELCHALKKFEGRGFTVCGSVNIEDGTGTVRFHQRRVGEPPWISEDLEAYAEEAVFVLEV